MNKQKSSVRPGLNRAVSRCFQVIEVGFHDLLSVYAKSWVVGPTVKC